MRRSVIRQVGCLIVAVLTMASCASRRLAAEALTPLSEEQQRRYDYFFLEAVNQEMQENYDVAFDLLQHCLAIWPQAPSAHYELASYYSYLGDKEKALELMQKAVAYEPTNFWYKENLAQAYCQNEAYDEAIAIYEDMDSRFPKRAAELLPTLIGLYNATEQYDKEIDALGRMEERFGHSEEISLEKFRIYWKMEDYESAFRVMEGLAEGHPDDSRFRLMLGDVYLENNRSDEALATYQQVLAAEPENDMAHLGMANWYERNGQVERAHAIADSLVVFGNLPEETRMKITSQFVQRYEARRDTAAIVDFFSRILDRPQPTATMAQACASYYINANKPDTLVVPVLKKVLEVEPDNTAALKQMLYYAVQHNDTEEVRERSRALLAYYPDELYAYYYLVITALRDDDDAQAVAYCKEGISHFNEESDTELCSHLWSILGDLYFQMNEDDMGYAAYDSALVYNPAEVSVLNNYAYKLSIAGNDLDRAEEMSSVTIQKEPTNSTYLDTYAWILFKKERYEEARIYIDQALLADTTQSDVLLEHAGDIYYCGGQPEEALSFWKEALQRRNEAARETPLTTEEKKALDKLKRKIRLKKWMP